MATLTGPSGPIDYFERAGSPTESMSGNTFKVRRIFDVAWSDRWAFCRAVFGWSRPIGTNENAIVDRYVPALPYRVDTGLGLKSFMYPTTLEQMEGVGTASWDAGTLCAKYDTARVTVGYETVPYTIRNNYDLVATFGTDSESCLGRYVSVWIQPTAEYLTLPYGALRWCLLTDGVGPEEPGTMVTGSHGRIIPAAEIMIVWHQVPGLPAAASELLGSINNADFGNSAKSFFWFKETLLYTNCELKPYRWFDNKLYYDITYKFKLFDPNGDGSVGHNQFLRYRPQSKDADPQPYTYNYLSHNGKTTGQRVYPEADFNSLFTSFIDTTDLPIELP